MQLKFERVLTAALPKGMRSWVCVTGGYSWCITCEDGKPFWTDAEKAEWCGYRASYRELPNGGIKTVDGVWKAFPFAVQACKIKLRELQNASKKVEVQSSIQGERQG